MHLSLQKIIGSPGDPNSGWYRYAQAMNFLLIAGSSRIGFGVLFVSYDQTIIGACRLSKEGVVVEAGYKWHTSGRVRFLYGGEPYDGDNGYSQPGAKGNAQRLSAGGETDLWYRSVAVIGIRLDGDRVAEKASLNEDTEAAVSSYKNSRKGLSVRR